MVAQFLTLLAGGLGVSYTLDRWAGHEFPTLLCLATFGSFISYIYSAPPLKLKQSGWIGNYALGSSYIALPWWAGQVGTLICVSVCVCLCVCVCVACNVAVAHLTVYILPEAAVTAACHVTSLNRSAATVPRTSFFCCLLRA